jgi:hypothetical protein
MNGSLRLDLLEELLRRRDADRIARSSLVNHAADQYRAALARIQRVDDENAVWLRHVLAGWKWPGRSLVGDEGSHAAWLLAQHADRDPALQRLCLKLLEEAVENGQASAVDLAFLTDRVLLASGEDQIYGTQISVVDGQFAASRLSDPDAVDARRESVGLDRLSGFLRQVLEVHGPPSPARIVCPGCGGEIEVWLPELGGRSEFQCAVCHRVGTLRPLVRTTQVSV